MITNRYLWFVGILFFISCKKINTDNLTNLNNNHITVLGHRGNGINGTFPGNSLESMEAAIDELGAEGVEMDVQLSKDGELILFHDDELATLTSCNGKINSHTKDELEKCLYDTKFFNAPLRDYHLASLESIFARFKNYSPLPIFFLDTKYIFESENYIDSTNQFNSVFGKAIYNLIAKYKLEKVVLVSSSSRELLNYLKNNFPSLNLVFHADTFDNGLDTAKSLGLFGITLHYQNITREQMETAHTNNVRVTIYGVGAVASCKETVRLFPDYVKTDNITYLLSLMN